MKQTIDDYLTSLSGKKITVLGIGVSNIPLIRLLCKAGLQVTACDKRGRAEFNGQIEELESLGATVILGADYLSHLLGQDVIFRTPGLRPDFPQIKEAVEHGAILTSEMEVFFRVCPCPIIGVTGSDGKTTTTTIIAKLLETAGYTVHLGGNIGKPLLPEVSEIRATDYAVVELSSFQLMTMRQSPQIAVVTNLAPNHLDVHRSMDEYVEAKKNIFLYQSEADKLILNWDNGITHSFVGEEKGSLTLFSRQGEPSGNSVFYKDGAIWISENGETQKVLERDNILLPGDHNVENYMAAIGAVAGLVPMEKIQAFAKQFGGVEHRIELVRELNGVRYYNDSIASSPTRTIAGLKCFAQKVILIAGGYDKHIPFDVLGPVAVEHVKCLILTGATAPKLRAAIENAVGYDAKELPIIECDEFADAVKTARDHAQSGDVVLMSPACASFDRFKNFVERGNTFKDIVNNFEERKEV